VDLECPNAFLANPAGVFLSRKQARATASDKKKERAVKNVSARTGNRGEFTDGAEERVDIGVGVGGGRALLGLAGLVGVAIDSL
jgi:hypothetical protein